MTRQRLATLAIIVGSLALSAVALGKFTFIPPNPETHGDDVTTCWGDSDDACVKWDSATSTFQVTTADMQLAGTDLTVGGAVSVADDKAVSLGNTLAAPDWQILHETADADQHNLTILNTDGFEDVVIAWDDGIDWGVTNSASLRVHSIDAAAPTEYVAMSHDSTDARLTIGSGGIHILPSSGQDLTVGNASTGSHDININVAAGNAARLILLHASNQRTIFQSNFSSDQTVISSAADGGRQLILSAAANNARDHDHDAETNPVFYVHSATDPDPDNTEYISLKHDQTDAHVSTLKGQIRLTAEADKGVVVPIEEAASLDAPCVAANEGAIMYFDNTGSGTGGFCGCVNFNDGGGTFNWAAMTASAPCP